jgi:hypothetical protein
MTQKYEIGAYYFPNYHIDARNQIAHGKGWTEWELVKEATPRFAGHDQPKVPLWGYTDEADPNVFAKKIDAAADHGLTNFIFDWYWYNDGPFLQRGLDEGYLGAANNHRLKFCLMWANHDWFNMHPRMPGIEPKLQYPGCVTLKTFETIMDFVIEKYFLHPSYWKIDGCPYFSIYELFKLVESLGGIGETRKALDLFRQKTKAAGFRDLHLNAVIWGIQILPGEKAIKNPNEMLAALNFDSITSYVWVHHVPMPKFPENDYRDIMAGAVEYWRKARNDFKLPYYPNVSMGWDNTARIHKTYPYRQDTYGPVIANNTPEAFREALVKVKEFLDSEKNGPKIFNINSWNEWTEGSYIEPDTKTGMAYLEAIGDVFEGGK